jgi:hypothetical protein
VTPFETVYDYRVTSAEGEFRGSVNVPRGTRISSVTRLVMRMVAKCAFYANLPLDPFNATITIKKQELPRTTPHD